jgi:hypothetical protein
LPLVEHLSGPDAGEIVPITLMTDEIGPSRSFSLTGVAVARPGLRDFSPGSAEQDGVCERAFRSLKYEGLYWEQIDDLLDLVQDGDAFRIGLNQLRPHKALSCTGQSTLTSAESTPRASTSPSRESPATHLTRDTSPRVPPDRCSVDDSDKTDGTPCRSWIASRTTDDP